AAHAVFAGAGCLFDRPGAWRPRLRPRRLRPAIRGGRIRVAPGPPPARALPGVRALVTDWVDHPELVEYYSTHRSKPEHLYPAGRRSLPELARRVGSVLDVGCGAGGFATIWRAYNPVLAYTGVDASAALVEAARRLHPDATFAQADGAGPLP